MWIDRQMGGERENENKNEFKKDILCPSFGIQRRETDTGHARTWLPGLVDLPLLLLLDVGFPD